jgi:hypothetical protein
MQLLGGSTSGYSYDAKNRLIQDDTTGTNAHDYTYTYDPVDNRLTSTEGGTYVQSTFDKASRLVTSVNASGTTSYTYSMEGTQSEVSEPPGGNLYTFAQDVEYRLASQTATPGGTRNWYYDANGKMQYYSGPCRQAPSP